jgi:flagellar biosynthesis protein
MSKHREEKVAALKYRPDRDEAPIIIASGYGTNAKKIIEIAEQQGIPIFRDDSTASLLCMLEVGTAIPPEVYEVVATIYSNILSISQSILQKNERKEAGHHDVDS